jgi:hypothetical protein
LSASEKVPWKSRVRARAYATIWRNCIVLQGNPLFKARCRISTRRAWCRRRRFQSATQLLGENTNDCLGWPARLDYLFELAPQIREGNLLRLLDHGLLVCLRYLLAHDLDMVVSTVVIVTDFAAGKRISDIEIEGLLRAGRNVCQLDCEDKAVHGAIGKGLLVPRGDLRCCLPLDEREAHRNPVSNAIWRMRTTPSTVDPTNSMSSTATSRVSLANGRAVGTSILRMTSGRP